MIDRGVNVFSHVMIGLNDVDGSTAFYDSVLSALGYAPCREDRYYRAYGEPTGPVMWINQPINGDPATVGNGSMVAMLAESRASVDEAYASAMAHGGTDEGAPGLRPHYHPDYYGAYFRDPEGNKLCVVCHKSE